MKLIVGLGNPGEKHKNNRHNSGFLVLDEFKKHQMSELSDFEFSKKFKAQVSKDSKFVLAKPQTFMNSSGDSVSTIAAFYKLNSEDIYVIHDELDIKLGDYKIQKGVGPKVHNGVTSIERSLGTKDFWRVRVGIDNRSLENRLAGEDYVLQNFSDEERDVFNKVKIEVVRDLINRIN